MCAGRWGWRCTRWTAGCLLAGSRRRWLCTEARTGCALKDRFGRGSAVSDYRQHEGDALDSVVVKQRAGSLAADTGDGRGGVDGGDSAVVAKDEQIGVARNDQIGPRRHGERERGIVVGI